MFNLAEIPLAWHTRPYTGSVPTTPSHYFIRKESLTDAKITIRENGPYRVEGDVPLFDHQGNRVQPSKPGGYSLSRCGGSANKPFCDGTHRKIGFIGDQVEAEPGG